jgi:hypothetical protein
MISCLFLVLQCLFAGSYECRWHRVIDDASRNMYNTVFHSDRRYTCDKRSTLSNGYYRFTAAGNEIIPLSPPKTRRCGTTATGWQSYRQPTSLYSTTSGKICYHYNSNTCNWYSYAATTLCAGYYVYKIEWQTWGCSGRICTTSGPWTIPTEGPTSLPTAMPTTLSPTSFPTEGPTSLPTAMPTYPCIDIYDYCKVLANNGYCYKGKHTARVEVHRSCALSCGTCFNKTISPSHHPAMPPTVAPIKPTYRPTLSPSTGNPTANPLTSAPSEGMTISPTEFPSNQPSSAPTCTNFLDYCEIIPSFCNSSSEVTKMKMLQDCALTCGLCSAVPTEAPSPKCVDEYSYCDYGSFNGGCYNQDYEARISFVNDCPISCGTCHGETLMPTNRPTIKPTGSPSATPTVTPSQKPSKQPSVYPTSRPSSAPTCMDLLGYCEIVKANCSSSELSVRTKLTNECAFTCGVCTSQPTMSPSGPCVDAYHYCTDISRAGACYDDENEARLHFINDCPASCNACWNQSMSPTFSPTSSPTLLPTSPTSSPSMNPSDKPTDQPSRAPTSSPTCLDVIGYCNYMKGYCNSTKLSVQIKMKEDCTRTCGFCVEELVENLAEDRRRRLTVTKKRRFPTALVILMVFVISVAVTSSTLLLRCIFSRRQENISFDRKDALYDLKDQKVTLPGLIVKNQ